MKKIFVLMLALCMLFSLAACGTDGQDETPGTNEPNEPNEPSQNGDGGYEITVNGETYISEIDPSTISVAAVVYQQDAHQSLIRQAAEDCANAYGVNIMTSVTNSDTGKALELLSTYTAQEIDGLIWAPSSTSELDPLKQAKDNGTIVTITNGCTEESYIQYFDGCYYNDPDSMCSTLSEISLEPIKEVYADKIAAGETLKIGVIAFDALSMEFSSQRIDAILNNLDAEGIPYEVVGRQDATEQDVAIQVATDMLTANPDLDMFISACEAGNIGAMMAINNAGAEDCHVFGIDVSVQIAKLMQEYPGVGICFVGQSSYEGGWRAAEQCIQLALGLEGNQDEIGKLNPCTDQVLNYYDQDGIQAYIDEMAELGITG